MKEGSVNQPNPTQSDSRTRRRDCWSRGGGEEGRRGAGGLQAAFSHGQKGRRAVHLHRDLGLMRLEMTEPLKVKTDILF